MIEAIVYRRPHHQDFFAIADLDRDVWARDYPFIPDGEHVWRIWVEYGLVYCAELDGQIIGGIVAFPTTTGTYCVHKAFVKAAHRGQGIGTRLFQCLLQELDALQMDAFLTVSPDNEHAVRIYERLGFTHRQFVRGYYREDEDRFVLTRHVGNSSR
jgi:[ribosomal protein S18]-alanine N-acetyltransferase